MKFLPVSVLLSAFLALATAAPTAQPQTSTLKLGLARQISVPKGQRLVDVDRARIEAIKARFQGKAPPPAAAGSSFPITNAAVTYTTQVGVGNPPTQYTLLIDTGSSNTWVRFASE